jgi:hypothetical protein
MLRSDLPISLPFSSTLTSKFEDGIDLNGIAGTNNGSETNTDLVVFDIPFKCKVYEAGIVILTGLAGDTNPGPCDFRFDVRKTAGSDTGRGDGDAGIIYLYETGASAQGEYVYDLAGQTPWAAGAGCSLLEPGMQVVFQTGASLIEGPNLAGKIKPFLLVEYMPEVRGNLVNAQETT